MNQKLKEKILESVSAVLPITGIVLLLSILLVPVDLGIYVYQLHEYVFGKYSFTPSETVQSISDQITKDTGF